MTEKAYKVAVLNALEEKKKAGLLPSGLLAPTPGALKATCIKRCEKELGRKDMLILNDFVGEKPNAAAYQRAFELLNADVFRSLAGFLRKQAVNTTLKNINLLAWLIDFSPRPFHPDLVIGPVPEEKKKARVEPEKIQPRKPLKKIIVIAAAIIVVTLGGYFVLQTRPAGNCMIWERDQYQRIDCQTKDAMPINNKLMQNFKRITRSDTLTPYSIGKVWYAKYKGNVEFYTAPGQHPLDTNRRLLPLSSYILEKYVYHIRN